MPKTAIPQDFSYRKRLILITAIDLFATREYGECTMRELASRLGIKAASLYYHFKSKEDLLNEIFNYFFTFDPGYRAPVMEVADKIEDKDDREILRKMFVSFVHDDHFFLMNKIVRISMRHQFENQKAREVFDYIFNEIFVKFKEDVFAELVRRGVFEPFDLETLSYLMTAFSVTILMEHTNRESQMEEYVADYSEALEAFVNLLAPILREKRVKTRMIL